MDTKLEQFEVKIAFLEHANAEMSDILSRQQRDIDLLRDRFAALSAKVAAMPESNAAPLTAEDERPPHY